MTPTLLEIQKLEEQLKTAMLKSDVSALDMLLSNELIFTSQTGQLLSKAMDVAIHKSGSLKLTRIDQSEQEHRIFDCGCVVSVKAELEGSFEGNAFVGSFRYTRVWVMVGDSFRVIAGHVSNVSIEEAMNKSLDTQPTP